jgi:hypothetical protein
MPPTCKQLRNPASCTTAAPLASGPRRGHSSALAHSYCLLCDAHSRASTRPFSRWSRSASLSLAHVLPNMVNFPAQDMFIQQKKSAMFK